MIEDNGLYILKTIVSKDIIFRSFILMSILVIAIILDALSEKSLIDFLTRSKFTAVAFSAFFAITILQIYFRMGYRISFDSVSIYLRPEGLNLRLKRHSQINLPYTDISSAHAESGNLNIYPFEFIRLTSKTRDLGKEFFLSRMFLDEDDLRTLVLELYRQRPDIFDDRLSDYIS